MKVLPSILVVFLAAIAIVCSGGDVFAQKSQPSGAKAIFDSGEGPAVRMSSGPAVKTPTQTAAAPAKEKYVGISYKLVLLRDDGRFDIVPRSRTFRSGERLKLLVRTNKPGYLTIMNIGTSGNTTVLCSEQVEAGTMMEIPRGGNFRFSGAPGTEKLLVMLSGQPNPMGMPSQGQTMAQAPAAPPPPDGTNAALPPPPPPGQADVANIPPPPPPGVMTASLAGGKDITLEDGNKTSYAVISPKSGWKPEPKGRKDIVLETRGGENYGVVPASYIEDGKILTLEIKLNHR
jgi:hypothetical protein